MKEALIIIDYQYDFVAKDGKLSGGEDVAKIEKNIKALAYEHTKKGNDIIIIADTHKASDWDNHMESKSFPIHCEKGEKGHEIYGVVKDILEYKNTTYIEKSGYAPSGEKAREIAHTYDKIVLCGIMTDICVVQTGVVIYNEAANMYKKLDICVNKSCCASFDEQKHTNGIEYMKNILGFEIV